MVCWRSIVNKERRPYDVTRNVVLFPPFDCEKFLTN